MANAYRIREPLLTQPQNIKLKFEVDEVPAYTRTMRIAKRHTDGITKGLYFADEQVQIPEAWVVYFPGGHSIRVESKEEMIRLGYMEAPGVVDMETGEEVPVADTMSPKEIVKRATQARRGAL